jgi:hypothetical protein
MFYYLIHIFGLWVAGAGLSLAWIVQPVFLFPAALVLVIYYWLWVFFNPRAYRALYKGSHRRRWLASN